MFLMAGNPNPYQCLDLSLKIKFKSGELAHPVLLMWFLGLDAVFLPDSSPMEHPCPVGHGCQETHHARRGLQPALVTSVPGAVDKMP